MTETSRTEDKDPLPDQHLLTLAPDRFDAIARALDNPPTPEPKLKALHKRTPAWEP